MFHLHILGEAAALTAAMTKYAEQHGVVVLPLPRTVEARHCVFEVSVGRNAMTKPPEFWLEHLKNCLETTLTAL